jgi:alpha-beta hydrolase superfamily lysophospholipase
MDLWMGTFNGSGGIELFRRRWRPPEVSATKAVVALVHGAGEHCGRYDNLVNWLVPRGYAVHAFDQRGHGRSPGARGHVNTFAEIRDDVGLFLDCVRQDEPGRPLFLLGHSTGGLIVLDYVLHDSAGLDGVIASGPLLSPLPLSPVLIAVSKLLARVWPGLLLPTGLEVEALSRDPEVVTAYVQDPLVHGMGSPRMAMELTAAIAWTQEHAGELNLPSLIVHGGDDRLCFPQSSLAFFEEVSFPDKERYEYEGYYHEIFNEPGREQVLADVEAWLERHL